MGLDTGVFVHKLKHSHILTGYSTLLKLSICQGEYGGLLHTELPNSQPPLTACNLSASSAMLQTHAPRLRNPFHLMGEDALKALNGYFSKNGSFETLIGYMKLFFLSSVLDCAYVQILLS